jgi:hemerythrin-like domain-containing protein
MKATEILMQEHRLIEQVLDYLEEAAGRLEDGEKIDPDFFIDAADFVAGFADGSQSCGMSTRRAGDLQPGSGLQQNR